MAARRADVDDPSPAALGHGRAPPRASARIGAITFSSQAACQSSSGTSSRARHLAVPALLTRTSSRPKLVRGGGQDALAGVGVGDVEASGSASAARRGAHSRAASASALGGAGDEQHAGALGAEHRRATSRPIPRLAPVTAQALPSSPRSTSDQPRRRSSIDDLASRALSARWTGHLPAITLRRSSLLLVRPLGQSQADLEASSARPTGRTPSRPRPRPSPRSQPLRSAYISIVIAVQEASAAARMRVGEGPWLAPPASSGSSIDQPVAALDLDVVGVALAAAGGRPNHRAAPRRGPRTAPGRRRRRSGPSRRPGRRRG